MLTAETRRTQNDSSSGNGCSRTRFEIAFVHEERGCDAAATVSQGQVLIRCKESHAVNTSTVDQFALDAFTISLTITGADLSGPPGAG